ncbi:MAG: hypothetical protein GY853_09585 [PVC group bacterium]|nr:hypothetical protein [PVC group bacterium]
MPINQKIGDLYLELKAQEKDIKKVQAQLKKVENAAKKSAEKTESVFKGSFLAIGKAAGVLLAVGVALKKTFDLGKMIAQNRQVEKSFNLLNNEVFKTPDLLEQMRKAVNGTINDTDLMSGALTLAAGNSNELNKAFGAAIPKLLEIAKASNKLNPTLGDTAFLYKSIATGVKRMSPLILDNLGIVVKIGEVQENYAKQLGKTVEQLSMEERQMALLNGVLKSGDKLLQQVGGNTDNVTDSFDQLAIVISNKVAVALDNLLPIFKQLVKGATVAFGIVGDMVDKVIEGLKAVGALEDDTPILTQYQQEQKEKEKIIKLEEAKEKFQKSTVERLKAEIKLLEDKKKIHKTLTDAEKAKVVENLGPVSAEQLRKEIKLAEEKKNILFSLNQNERVRLANLVSQLEKAEKLGNQLQQDVTTSGDPKLDFVGALSDPNQVKVLEDEENIIKDIKEEKQDSFIITDKQLRADIARLEILKESTDSWREKVLYLKEIARLNNILTQEDPFDITIKPKDLVTPMEMLPDKLEGVDPGDLKPHEPETRPIGEIVEEMEEYNTALEYSSGITDAFFENVRVQADASSSVLEKVWANMANIFIAQVQRMIAEWIAFQLIMAGINLITGGGGGIGGAVAGGLGGGGTGDSLGKINNSIQAMNKNMIEQGGVNVIVNAPDIDVTVERNRGKENQMEKSGVNLDDIRS